MGVVQDGRQGKTGSRFKLRGGRAPPCARCCARMRSRCMRRRCRRRRECVADLRNSCAGCGTGTGGNGLHSRCQLSLQIHGSLPNRVHGPLQDGWQVETGSRVTLCGRSAPPCARCCARMRSRCTRLPKPAATRVLEPDFRELHASPGRKPAAESSSRLPTTAGLPVTRPVADAKFSP